ncbi:hypothetical protein U1Q18_001854 [Sarracenia purpurea var. burkii]
MDSSHPFDPDLSSGYLQDALFEFTDRSKRRRLLLFADNQFKETNVLPVNYKLRETEFQATQSYWDSNRREDWLENFSYLSKMSSSLDGISGEPINRSVSRSSEEEASILTEMKAQEEDILVSEPLDSSSSSHKHSLNKPIHGKQTLYSSNPISPSDGGGNRKKRVTKRVVYPFALVKPGGVEGDVTLNDINERILMPPTRPVRHPVGDYAFQPMVSPDGPGLSGKAVVAFTRIHTQGRGTITIIRTKG